MNDINFREKYSLISNRYVNTDINNVFRNAELIKILNNKKIFVLEDLLSFSDADFTGKDKVTLPEIHKLLRKLEDEEYDKTIKELISIDENKIQNIRTLSVGFSTRTTNALMSSRIDTVDKLLSFKKEELLKINKLGKTSRMEIIQYLNSLPNESRNKKTEKISDIEDIQEIFDTLSDKRKQKPLRELINKYKSIYQRSPQVDIDNKKTLENLIKSDISIDEESYKFIIWCCFDVMKELDNWAKPFTNDREKEILLLRAEDKTLQEVGDKLDLTRERVRQIEAKISKKLNDNDFYKSVLYFISIECDANRILSEEKVQEYLKRKKDIAKIFLYLAKTPAQYVREYNFFILDDSDLKTDIFKIEKELPEQFIKKEQGRYITLITEKLHISEKEAEQIILKIYNKKKNLYFKGNFSQRKVIVPILEKYYKNGIKVYNEEELDKFRERIRAIVGDEETLNNRSLTAAISRVCVLCGKGKYKLQSETYVDEELKNKIWEYISKSKTPFVGTNLILLKFKKELKNFGITNFNHLQGVMHHLYGDKLIYKKTYVSKDKNHTSVSRELYEYIKNSKFPVSKDELKRLYPFINEIVIANAIMFKPDILNYQGKYMHVSNITLEDNDTEYLRNLLNICIEKEEVVNSRSLYDYIEHDNKNILTKCCIFSQSALFSLLEYCFSDEYQFSRPFVAAKGVEIGHISERICELVNGTDVVETELIIEFMRKNRIIKPQIECINYTNETHFILNTNTLVQIKDTGIDESVALEIENILLKNNEGTVPIYTHPGALELPKIKIQWTDWLVYSVLNKWGKESEVSIAPASFKFSYPLISKKGQMNIDKYKGVVKDEDSDLFEHNIYDDIEESFIESIEEEWGDVNEL